MHPDSGYARVSTWRLRGACSPHVQRVRSEDRGNARGCCRQRPCTYRPPPSTGPASTAEAAGSGPGSHGRQVCPTTPCRRHHRCGPRSSRHPNSEPDRERRQGTRGLGDSTSWRWGHPARVGACLGHEVGDSKGQRRFQAGSRALALSSANALEQRRPWRHAVYGMQGVRVRGSNPLSSTLHQRRSAAYPRALIRWEPPVTLSRSRR
jgi:hypothetical protein